MASVAAIDIDEPRTWPESTYRWAAQGSSPLAGSTAYTADLPGMLEEEDSFRATLGTEGRVPSSGVKSRRRSSAG